MELTLPMPHIWVPRYLRREETRKEAGLINRGVVNNSLAQAHSDIIWVGNAVTPISGISNATLLAWYKPLAATMFTTSGGSTNVASDGDPVGRWEDQHNNYDMEQTNADTRRPVYKVNIQNGKPAVLFTPASSQILTEETESLAGQFAGDDQAITIACFVKQSATTGVQNLMSVGSGSDGNNWGIRTEAGSGDYEFRRSDGATAGLAGGGTPNTNANWYVWRDNGGSSTVDLWINGTQILSGVSYTANVGALGGFNYASIGGHRGTSIANFLNGYIGEMAIWRSALSAGDVALANTYGQSEWATW